MAAKRTPVTLASAPALGGEASFFKTAPAAAAAVKPAAVDPAPVAPVEPAVSAPTAPAEPRTRRPAAERAARASSSAARPAGDEELLACQIYVPEELLDRARKLMRPAATGGRRGLTKTLMIAAYARAIHSLELAIDTTGIERGMDDELAQRVLDALNAHFTGGAA